MKIVEFRLHWNDKIFNQVIIGWSIIRINLLLEEYNGEKIFLDISNYSKKWIFEIVPELLMGKYYLYNELIQVDYLWQSWLFVKKNDLKSRVKISVNWVNYFSNTIGDYKYIDSFLFKESTFYDEGDHHLWVYNKYSQDWENMAAEITEINKYPNDIIFIDRKYDNIKGTFIDLDKDIKIIFYKYKANLLGGKKSIFYINMLSEDWEYPFQKIKKILSLCKKGTYYFYNIVRCQLENEWQELDKDVLLYDYHFKPLNRKKKIKDWSKCKQCLYLDICSWKI